MRQDEITSDFCCCCWPLLQRRHEGLEEEERCPIGNCRQVKDRIRQARIRQLGEDGIGWDRMRLGQDRIGYSPAKPRERGIEGDRMRQEDILYHNGYVSIYIYLYLYLYLYIYSYTSTYLYLSLSIYTTTTTTSTTITSIITTTSRRKDRTKPILKE